MKKIILVTLCLTFSHIIKAATQFNFSPDIGKVQFKTKGWPNLVTIKGVGKGVTGTLTEADLKVTGDLEFDLNSLDTGIKLRDDHMKNKYLQTKQFPKAKLNLKDVTLPADFDGSTPFKGTLDLHGVAKEVSGTMELDDNSSTIDIEAEIPIKLTDFKIEIPNYKGITVAEKVTIKFEAKITKMK